MADLKRGVVDLTLLRRTILHLLVMIESLLKLSNRPVTIRQQRMRFRSERVGRKLLQKPLESVSRRSVVL